MQDNQDIFDSEVRSAGDLAGVFEYDGDTGYFYLYEVAGQAGQKVLSSIHVVSGPIEFSASDVQVQWDVSEQRVGLFIHDTLWATFDTARRRKYGGNYVPGAVSTVPGSEMFPKR